MSTGDLIVRPSYLTPEVEDPNLLQEMNKAAKSSFIKLVYAQSGAPFRPQFNDGDIVVSPNMIKIGDKDTPFSFSPIYYFTHFWCLNPFNMKGQIQGIREMTFDEDSVLAKKCKTFAKEVCPENPKEELKYQQCYNFLVRLDHPDLKDDLFNLMFAGGEARTGQNFIGMIKKRNTTNYFCTRFRAISSHGLTDPAHAGPKGKWWGYNISNDPIPWVDEIGFKQNRELHKMAEELVLSRQIVLTPETDNNEDSGGDAAKSESKF